MKKVLFELKDKSDSVLWDMRFDQNEVDSMKDVARKQHARAVLCTGQPRILPLRDSITLHLSIVGR
jgi:hypothetical protein